MALSGASILARGILSPPMRSPKWLVLLALVVVLSDLAAQGGSGKHHR